MSNMYIGQIVMFGGNFAIRDYDFCSGQLLTIPQHTALFSILGTTYGGDGRTNFALPDLRGRAPVHAGAVPGQPNRPLGQRYGVETVTLSQGQMPSHSHSATVSNVDATLKATTSDANQQTPQAGNMLAKPGPTTTGIYSSSPGSTVDLGGVSAEGGDVSLQPTGNGQGFEVSAPRAVVNFEMLMQGNFPPRN
jgi:microcystin-dependent protein